jgi:hypothetical protein
MFYHYTNKDGCTSSLTKHLKNVHNKHPPQARKKKCSVDDDDGLVRPKTKRFIGKQAKLSTEKTDIITYKLAKTIFLDLQPLSVVEDQGFRELIQETSDGRYTIPSRKTLRYNILPYLYDKAAKCVKTVIAKYQKENKSNSIYSITTDGWTSRACTSFVTYTLHLLVDYRILSFVLSTTEVSERHTAENLTAHLIKTIVKWGVIEDSDDPETEPELQDIPDHILRQLVVTTDNASNITKAITSTPMQHVRCFAHTLNLSMEKFVSILNNQLMGMRKIVKYFHNSALATTSLKVSKVDLV